MPDLSLSDSVRPLGRLHFCRAFGLAAMGSTNPKPIYPSQVRYEPSAVIEASTLFPRLRFVLGWVAPNVNDAAIRFIRNRHTHICRASPKGKRGAASQFLPPARIVPE
jgi:hypothetical protein